MRWHQDSKLVINISKKKWVEGESEGVELGWEGNTDGDTDLDIAYEKKFAELDALATKFLNGQPTVDEIASELGAEVVGGRAVEQDVPTRTEETPPLPGEKIVTPAGDTLTALTEVRTPMDDNGDEFDIFPVERIKITVSDTGTKFAKVFGGRWQKFGVTVWEEVMEGVFPIGDLDVGHEFKPAQALKAKAILNEKGNPKKVVEFV